MIFFGTKGKTVSGEVIDGVQCPSCENTQFMTFGIIKYFHLYWIPTLVTSKTAGMECVHCKRTLVDKEIPDDLVSRIKDTVFTTKNTLPLFSGLIILGCFALFMVHVIQQDSKQEAAYIAQPAVNDLYIVDLTKIFPDADSAYRYGLLRIKNTSGDQTEFSIGEMAYNKASGIRDDIRNNKTASDSYFEGESYSTTLSELKQSGAIYSIERK